MHIAVAGPGYAFESMLDLVSIFEGVAPTGRRPSDGVPAPWRISDTGSAFKITDARGRAISHVCYRRENVQTSEYLCREEAFEMAQAIARLSRGARKCCGASSDAADEQLI